MHFVASCKTMRRYQVNPCSAKAPGILLQLRAEHVCVSVFLFWTFSILNLSWCVHVPKIWHPVLDLLVWMFAFAGTSNVNPKRQGNLELVSGKFTFYKDRRSQLWLVDAKVLWRGSGMLAVFVHSNCLRQFNMCYLEFRMRIICHLAVI